MDDPKQSLRSRLHSQYVAPILAAVVATVIGAVVLVHLGLSPGVGGGGRPRPTPPSPQPKDAGPAETHTDVEVIGPTSPGEFTLVAHVGVTDGEGSLDGTVVFLVNGQETGRPAPLRNGKAELDNVPLDPGTNRISAEFRPGSGVTSCLGSKSESVELVVR